MTTLTAQGGIPFHAEPIQFINCVQYVLGISLINHPVVSRILWDISHLSLTTM